jgi:fibronectin-binding autotransporter adhesin
MRFVDDFGRFVEFRCSVQDGMDRNRRMTDIKPTNSSRSFVKRTRGALLSALAVILLLSVTSHQAEAQTLMVGSNSSGQTTNFTSGTNTFTYAYIGATATDSNNTLNVFNPGTRLTISSGNVQVGYAGNNNSMVISNGGFVSDVTGVISYGADSNNSALVTGAGSTWSNSTQVRLGVSGQGTLTVANGGSVVATGANGIQTAVNVGSVGVLNIGSYGGNDSAGSIIAPLIAFGAGTGTLNFNQTNTFTLTNAVTGVNTIRFQQLGSGTTILTGANSSANSTFISQGTLQIGDGGANGSIGSGAITNNSVLAINSSTNITFGAGNGIRGTGALIQMGTGTTILDATNTTYSGGTLICGGTLQVGTATTFDTNGSLGSGDVTNNGTLLFNRQDVTQVIANNISGDGTLKTLLSGASSLILIGSNSYTGSTVISSGTLQIGTGSTNGTLGSGLVSNAGTLFFNRSDLYTVANTISGSGTLSQIGSGTTILLSSNSYTGGTTVTNGILEIGNGGTSGSVGSGGITLSGGGILAFNRADSVTLTNSIVGGGGVLSQMGAGTLVINATSATYGQTVISSGTLQIGDGSANGSIGSRAITNNSLLVVNSSTNFTFALGNGITGTGALIQMGTGTTILNATNTTYSGGTLISGGTLQVGTGANYDTNGSLGTGNVTNNATLAFKRNAQNDTVSNNISGTGALTVLGSSGALTLAGSNSFSGLTTITSGNTLQIGTGRTNGTLGSGSVSNAGTLKFNRSDLYTVTNTISGSGAFSQIGSGTTILSGSNSYSGGTTITNGTLLANNTTGSAVGTNTVNVTGGGSLGGNGTIGGRAYIATNSSLIPGSGGLSDAGALTFTHGLTLQSGAKTAFLINATNNFTSINLSGWSVSYGGTLTFNLTNYAPLAVAGNTFTLFNLTDGATESGNFTSLTAIGDTISFTNNAGIWTGTDTYGSTYRFSVATGQLSVASTVPEPSAYTLFGLGALALIISYRARSRRVA